MKINFSTLKSLISANGFCLPLFTSSVLAAVVPDYGVMLLPHSGNNHD